MEDKIKKTIQSYNDIVDEYIGLTDDMVPEEDMKDFLSHLKKSDKILDLGCGPGRDAKIFTERGYEVMGIDLSEGMIAAAKKRAPEVDFRLMDMRDLNLEDEYFNGVWACASLMHIPKADLKDVLIKLKNILKPGGIFFLGMKKGEGEGTIPDDRYGGVDKFFTFFQEKEILELIDSVGFEILHHHELPVEGYNAYPWINVMCKIEKGNCPVGTNSSSQAIYRLEKGPHSNKSRRDDLKDK